MEETVGQDILLVFFYLSLGLGIFFFVLGTGAYFFMPKSMAYLEAQFSDQEVWQQEHHDVSLQEAKDKTQLIILIAGIVSYILSLLLFIAAYFSFKINTAYEAIQSIIEVLNFFLLLAGFSMIFSSVYASQYQQFSLVTNHFSTTSFNFRKTKMKQPVLLLDSSISALVS
jgi:hypothetical protein